MWLSSYTELGYVTIGASSVNLPRAIQPATDENLPKCL